MQCDICGKEARLFRAKVEDTVVSVCEGCASFGEVIGRVAESPLITKTQQAQQRVIQKEEPREQVIEGFSAIIKNKREALGLKQVDFAKRINEKDSLVHKIETGAIVPPIELARKIERFLGIKLVEVVKEEKVPAGGKPGRPDELTLGDALKLKK